MFGHTHFHLTQILPLKKFFTIWSVPWWPIRLLNNVVFKTYIVLLNLYNKLSDMLIFCYFFLLKLPRFSSFYQPELSDNQLGRSIVLLSNKSMRNKSIQLNNSNSFFFFYKELESIAVFSQQMQVKDYQSLPGFFISEFTVYKTYIKLKLLMWMLIYITENTMFNIFRTVKIVCSPSREQKPILIKCNCGIRHKINETQIKQAHPCWFWTRPQIT